MFTLREAPTVTPMPANRQNEAKVPAQPQEPAPLEAATAPHAEAPGTDADIDLGPRIEALKAFLARYPSRSLGGDEAAAKPGISQPAGAEDFEELEATAPAHVPQRIEDVHHEQLFRKEPDPEPEEEESSAESRSALPVWIQEKRHQRIAAAVIVAIVAAIGFAGVRFLPSASADAPGNGTLTIGTAPAGISVLIDGSLRGATPLTVELPPGKHLVELAVGSEPRQIPVTIIAGGQMSQFFELPSAASEFGELQVRTDPPGASIIVDGRTVGRSPMTVPGLTEGEHSVLLQHESRSVSERVLIESGRTASLVVTMAGTPAANAAGWISVSSPGDVQVFENWRLLGNSNVERIMLPVGRHELEFVNEALGYRVMQTVQVTPGQVAQVKLQWPQGTLALNAVPWAEVWIDGEMKGETPIGSLSIPIGVHEIVFRHPELGEKRSSVTVTAGKLVKVGVDLRAK